MIIDKDTKIYGSFAEIAGNVGCHFFNKGFQYYNLNSIYKSFSINNIETAIESIKILNFYGLGITMPFKRTVINYVDILSDEVINIKSSNTVINNNGILKAYNTDYLSIKEYLKQIDTHNKTLHILGNGGYSLSVQYVAQQLNIEYNIVTRKNWSIINTIKNSIIFNCTPVNDIIYDNSNVFIDCIVTTETGKELSYLQALHQFKLYTGLDYPSINCDDVKKTIFLDIDGCVLKHHGNLSKQILSKPELLPGVIEKLNEWDMKGYKIILTTGRKESLRKITEEHLLTVGVIYDQLVMGINRGERIIINDSKPDLNIRTVSAIQIERNIGIKNIQLL
jgi:shikimate 5-dehydrogenase